MGSLNKVIIIGHIGRDAELRYTNSGQAVAGFSVATTDVWNDKSGQKQERTEWHNISLWGAQAEKLSQYLVKGKQVCIEGSLQTDEYADKEGQKRRTTKIKAARVVLLGSAGGDGSARRSTSSEQTSPAADHDGPLTDDDIPF